MKTKTKRRSNPPPRRRPHKKKAAAAPATQAMVVYQKDKPVSLRRDQVDLIRRMYARDTTEDEFMVYMQIARSTRLDPFKKQIYCIVFSKNDSEKRQMVIITGIDGYRSVAARDHKDYVGASNARFEMSKEKTPSHKLIPISCTLEILSKTGPPITVTRRWDEVAPHNLNEDRAQFWSKSPCDQLEKCTEAKGLRKRYPGLGNLFVDAELDRAKMEETPGGRAFTIDGKRPDGSTPPSYQMTSEAEKTLRESGRWCEKHNCHVMRCPADDHTPAENEAAYAAERAHKSGQAKPKETTQTHQKGTQVHKERKPAPETRKPAPAPEHKDLGDVWPKNQTIDIQPTSTKTEKKKEKPKEMSKTGAEVYKGVFRKVMRSHDRNDRVVLQIQIDRIYFRCWRSSIFEWFTDDRIGFVFEVWVKDGVIGGILRCDKIAFADDGKTPLSTASREPGDEG